MKKEEKEFNVNIRRPQVLFLGNGICRAYGGISWNRLLDEIKEKDEYPMEARYYQIPMPLKAAMLTNNSLANKLRNVVLPKDKQNPKVDGYDWTSFTKVNAEMKKQLRSLIGKNFDYVLTTNYGYEIETALMDSDCLTSKQIRAMMSFYEVNNAQTQFLVNTFNEANGVPVWHIHGEARKPDSMIIGNYYYGKLLRRCVERLDGDFSKENSHQRSRTGRSKTDYFKINKSQNRPIKVGSWIDAFVLGDVYVLGFGLDFSEVDIWWLLEYKANHTDLCGNTYYFNPKKEVSGKCIIDDDLVCRESIRFVNGAQCRDYLLENTYGVSIKNLDISIQRNKDYCTFYEMARDEITVKLMKR